MLILIHPLLEKNIKVDLAIVSDVTELLKSLIKDLKKRIKTLLVLINKKLQNGGKQIGKWREKILKLC